VWVTDYSYEDVDNGVTAAPLKHTVTWYDYQDRPCLVAEYAGDSRPSPASTPAPPRQAQNCRPPRPFSIPTHFAHTEHLQ